ncbi:expressed unknown protein [Seminavis robusta]|uniref:Uncharacterized protein n=1 Tax=Seminavis robusta TaxID=568900 RepID=A0A9N8H4Y1_9STRA|nr:expressed unknown protein [Seminavis robusta]|eukprot:Sro15_g010970.1 n/a (452) ;mRNA; r:41606-43092
MIVRAPLSLFLLSFLSQWHLVDPRQMSDPADSPNNLRQLMANHNAQLYCRPAAQPPHQVSTWQNDFPNDLNDLPVGLCEGTIQIMDDGRMCATGKVSYDQLQAVSGPLRPIYQLTAGEISINGHMIGGSGYVWLGPEVRYLYDFITSYTVEGVEYPNDSRINDNLVAASRGAIDGVCLSPEFRTEERFYEISHKTTVTTNEPLDLDIVDRASYTWISRYLTNYEFHEWRASDGGIFDIGQLTYKISNGLTTLFAFVSMPSITSGGGGLFSFIPTNVFAPLSRTVISGTLSTLKFPVPVSAPDDITEAIQIDVEYRVLRQALKRGLFTSKRVPLYYYVRFKRVYPFENSNSCWNETAVILEITGPQGDGAKLDAWVDEVVTPALLDAGGTIGLHFGKRIPPRSLTTQKALEKYASCGAELNLSPANCYHPQCARTTTPQQFTYPPQYYTYDA